MRGNLRRGMALVRRRTPTGSPLTVILYEKDGCHLCEDVYTALQRISDRSRPLSIVRTPTDDRYLLRIPVLVVGDAELDAAGLHEEAILRWLEDVAPRSSTRSA